MCKSGFLPCAARVSVVVLMLKSCYKITGKLWADCGKSEVLSDLSSHKSRECHFFFILWKAEVIMAVEKPIFLSEK